MARACKGRVFDAQSPGVSRYEDALSDRDDCSINNVSAETVRLCIAPVHMYGVVVALNMKRKQVNVFKR